MDSSTLKPPLGFPCGASEGIFAGLVQQHQHVVGCHCDTGRSCTRDVWIASKRPQTVVPAFGLASEINPSTINKVLSELANGGQQLASFHPVRIYGHRRFARPVFSPSPTRRVREEHAWHGGDAPDKPGTLCSAFHLLCQENSVSLESLQRTRELNPVHGLPVSAGGPRSGKTSHLNFPGLSIFFWR